MRILSLIALTLALASCGPDAKHITLDGKLLNMNQGEFLVYSPDAAMPGVDTITVAGGRFSLTTACERPGTAAILLPGGQEVPVFVSPGHSYSLSGDAQNLAELRVKGGDDNKLMNSFRSDLAKLGDTGGSPAAVKNAVQQFVTAHPASPVSMYLVGHYLLGAEPDAPLALRLVAMMRRVESDNAALDVLASRVAELANASQGHTLPAFTATDIDGRPVSASDLRHGQWVIATCASWDYESMSQVRRLRDICRESGGATRVLAIALDASPAELRSSLRGYGSTDTDPTAFRTVCDGQMLESPVLSRLAMRQTGLTMLVSNGRITGRNITGETLYSRLKAAK